jgi:omega-amidase
MQDLNVALIQSNLEWENRKANLEKFDQIFLDLKPGLDLILLPEMFNTAFSMDPAKLAEGMEGETVAWLRKKAAEKNAAVTGSLIIQEKGNYYNRLIWMFPDGKYQYYDKKHLFTLAGEQNHYTAGSKKLIVDYKGWKFCPMICYDLRFPVWIRNTEKYDCLIFVANWPEPRVETWELLLLARALENQCYVLGVNRVGLDGNSINHTGNSMAINPIGKVLTKSTEIETVLYAQLDHNMVSRIRKNMPFLDDMDKFQVFD